MPIPRKLREATPGHTSTEHDASRRTAAAGLISGIPQLKEVVAEGVLLGLQGAEQHQHDEQLQAFSVQHEKAQEAQKEREERKARASKMPDVPDGEHLHIDKKTSATLQEQVAADAMHRGKVYTDNKGKKHADFTGLTFEFEGRRHSIIAHDIYTVSGLQTSAKQKGFKHRLNWGWKQDPQKETVTRKDDIWTMVTYDDQGRPGPARLFNQKGLDSHFAYMNRQPDWKRPKEFIWESSPAKPERDQLIPIDIDPSKPAFDQIEKSRKRNGLAEGLEGLTWERYDTKRRIVEYREYNPLTHPQMPLPANEPLIREFVEEMYDKDGNFVARIRHIGTKDDEHTGLEAITTYINTVGNAGNPTDRATNFHWEIPSKTT